MSATRTVVVAVGLATMAIEAAGPVVLGGRPPPGAARAGPADGPALLAALVVTEVFGGDRALVLDERSIGVGAAAVALALRAPILLVIVVAAMAAALARLALAREVRVAPDRAVWYGPRRPSGPRPSPRDGYP